MDVELTKGQREKAIALLSQAAKDNPTSMVPWLRMANIWFDAGNYPSSILAANEVLQRDATSQEAKSLLVVSGLRVAAGAVSGLRSGSPVNSNARVEAENLTNSLRSILGEKSLIPATAESRQPALPVRSRFTPQSRPSPASVSNAASGAPHSSHGSGATDPFKSLK